MRKISKKLFALLALAPAYALAAGSGILSTFTENVKTQVTEAGSSIASIINTIATVFGVLWIIIMLLMAFFNMEGIKQHAKLIFGALVIIGVVYGISAAAM